MPCGGLLSDYKIVDHLSYIVAAATLLGSFFIFFRDTGKFAGSFAAALMTAGLVWATYIVLRWLLLAKRE